MTEKEKRELIDLIETLSTASEDLGYNICHYSHNEGNEVIDAIKGFKSQTMNEIINIIKKI